MALLSTCLTLLIIEGALRVRHGGLTSAPPGHYAGMALEILRSSYPATYDPLLGYKPEPGAAGRENPWKTTVTITEDGFRSNGRGTPPTGGPPVVAVGDSFTFGDEVSDGETWPAYLEQALGRPVLNAGVFGYGLDQAVLRAEAIVETTRPAILIVSITPDDIARCEYSYRFAWKPYFDLAGGDLVLRNIPVPVPGTPAGGDRLFPTLLRRSHLVSMVVRELDPDRWAIPESIRVHDDGLEVSKRLLDRIAGFGRERGVRVVFMAQWAPGPDYRKARALVAHAREAGIEALDLERPLNRMLPPNLDEVARWGRLFNVDEEGGRLRIGHKNPQGNKAVAEILAEHLGAPTNR
ncbi:MAG: hypothetical protein Q8R92_15440 [Deltaproteobacteria bacterium]|nr:hypothetical protein [Deltaproteobacteria bacterium]